MTNFIAWVDVETTGLLPKPFGGDAYLLELAAVITDAQLQEVDRFAGVVRYSEHEAEALREGANEFVRAMHDRTGLWSKLPEGQPLESLDSDFAAFLERFHGETKPRVGGNSVRLDLNFLEAFMPQAYSKLHYRSVDMSALQWTSTEWYGTPEFEKSKAHTAYDDIRESIAQAHYLKNIGHGFTNPLVSVDPVAFVRAEDGSLSLRLVERTCEPHVGELALPGVLMSESETVSDAVERALHTKLELPNHESSGAVFRVFDQPKRDERARAISLATIEFVDDGGTGELVSPLEIPELPFDHAAIVNAACEHVLSQVLHTPELMRALMGDTFSTGELNNALTSLGLDDPHGNLARTLLNLRWIEAAGRAPTKGRGRPARLWRVRD